MLNPGLSEAKESLQNEYNRQCNSRRSYLKVGREPILHALVYMNWLEGEVFQLESELVKLKGES